MRYTYGADSVAVADVRGYVRLNTPIPELSTADNRERAIYRLPSTADQLC